MKTKGKPKPVGNVYAIFDQRGQLVDVVAKPGRIMGFKGWSAVRGTWTPAAPAPARRSS